MTTNRATQQKRSQRTKYDFDLNQFIDEVISRLRVEDVYTDASHQFKESSDKHRGGCPFHDSKSGTSFNVSHNSLLFYCAGCQFGGSAITYLHSLKTGRWDKPRRRDFTETLQQLAELAGMSLPERELSPEQIEATRKWEARREILQVVAEYGQEVLWSSRGEVAKQYLIEERGLTENGIRELGLGFYLSRSEVQQVLADKGYDLEDAKDAGVIWSKLEGYILFPWLDSRGRPLTIYGRYQTKTPPQEKPKTIALPGEGTKGSPLYFDRALKAGHKELVLVEGVLDAALLQSVGDARVCGYVAASCSEAQIETMRRHGVKAVTLCGDPDDGGDNGTTSNIDRITKAGIKVYVAPKLPDDLDPDEFLLREGVEGWRRHIDAAVHAYTWKARNLIKKFGEGKELSDKTKAAILQQAIAFSKGVQGIENAIDLKAFLWPTICAELGVSADDFQPIINPTTNASEPGSGNDSTSGDGDGEYYQEEEEDDGWNPPVSWKGQIGWLVPVKQTKVERAPDTGEMKPVLDEKGNPIKEHKLKFFAKCNFDFVVEREITSEDGGGLVLQFKRVFDGVERQKRLIIKSTDYTEKSRFVDALKIAAGEGIVCNLKTDQLGDLFHSRIKEYRKSGGKVYRLADRIGQQEDGTWVFSDRQFTKEGQPTSEEETGWVFNPNLGKEDFIPCPQIAQKDPDALRNLIEAQRKFAGSNFMYFLLCDGYVAAALNYQLITSVEKFFPILNPTGDPGGMKTVAVHSGLSMAGWGNSDHGALASASVSMAYERLKCLGSIPSLWDDPASKTRQDKEALDEFFKRQYNALPRTVRGNTQKPHSPIIPTTNHSLGETVPAAKTRIISLFMPVVRDGDRGAWQELVGAKEKASGAFEYLISIGYPRSEVKALQARLQKHLPTAHERAADNLSILVFYTQKVVELAGLEIDVERWVIENLCPGLNAAQTGLNSSTDFFEKLGALRATNHVGLWNCDVVMTKSHGQCLALHMPSIWPALDQQFSPTYNYPVLEQALVGLGAIKNKSVKLYPNRDITLAYIREVHKGASKGEDWVEPTKPAPIAKKCLLIPRRLWGSLGIGLSDEEDLPLPPGGGDLGGGPSPHTPPPSPVTSVTSPVTSVTSGYLNEVTGYDPYAVSLVDPSKDAGYLVTKNNESKEKKEKSIEALEKSESHFSTKNPTQPGNQVTRLPGGDSMPETLASTTLRSVTSVRLPQVTKVTGEGTNEVTGAEVVQNQAAIASEQEEARHGAIAPDQHHNLVAAVEVEAGHVGENQPMAPIPGDAVAVDQNVDARTTTSEAWESRVGRMEQKVWGSGEGGEPDAVNTESAIAPTQSPQSKVAGFEPKLGDQVYVRCHHNGECSWAKVILMGTANPKTAYLALHLTTGRYRDFDQVDFLPMPQSPELELPTQSQQPALPSSAAASASSKPTELKVGDAVALADLYAVAYNYHGIVEDIQQGKVSVRWAERQGKSNEVDSYTSSELRRIQK